MRALGFMSGTSLDGVDVALVETDGERITELGDCACLPFGPAERGILERATQDALAWDGHGPQPGSFAPASAVIDAMHLRAGRQAIARGGGRLPDVVGFHGQTMLHRPERALSVQIGDPQALADGLGVPVVAGMRQDDLRAGGQGAPLVPAYHAALARLPGLAPVADRGGPLAFLNIGGVANLTWIGLGGIGPGGIGPGGIGRDGDLLACDTGPGNGLIDQIVQARGAGRYDEGGQLAMAGRVDAAILARLLDHPHFRGEGARSLDRYDFPLDWADGIALEDAVATLTAFTVEAVAIAARGLPEMPGKWVVCGGGSHNMALLRALRERLGDCVVADDAGLRGDFIEAEAMGFLAVRSLRGLPLTFPGTTGVSRPMTGGRVWHPRRMAA